MRYIAHYFEQKWLISDKKISVNEDEGIRKVPPIFFTPPDFYPDMIFTPLGFFPLGKVPLLGFFPLWIVTHIGFLPSLIIPHMNNSP